MTPEKQIKNAGKSIVEPPAHNTIAPKNTAVNIHALIGYFTKIEADLNFQFKNEKGDQSLVFKGKNSFELAPVKVLFDSMKNEGLDFQYSQKGATATVTGPLDNPDFGAALAIKTFGDRLLNSLERQLNRPKDYEWPGVKNGNKMKEAFNAS